jgi:serine phosphatase RsbU (regulator of sigma subunit)
MVEISQHASNFDSEDDALSMILEGTARVTGEAFFAALVENLAKAMKTHSAWVTEYIEASQQLRALAFWADGQLLTDVVVGDVTGHGVDAALLMTSARAFLRMRASQCGGISQIVTEMNRHLTLDMESNHIIDAIYSEIDTFSKGLKKEDDITLVIIKIEETSRKEVDWQI